MQAKFANKGFGKTASGKMNSFNNYQHKILDLDDFEVEMLSPQFLQGKTMKQPFKELDIHLQKTNPNGTRFQSPQRDFSRNSYEIEDRTQNKFYQNNSSLVRSSQPEYKYIETTSLNIKPAYSKVVDIPKPTSDVQLNFKDKNSIISALFKKGEHVSPIPMTINIKEPSEGQQKTKMAGPAEKKLKSLFKKEVKFEEKPKSKKQSKEAKQEIEEDIYEEINEQYENQSFEKLSGAYESAIKESIRQSIGGSSGAIKQSIRESIRQSSMKEQIPQSMSYKESGLKSSKEEIKEEIFDMKKESIDEEIYDEDFEEASISDQLSKSKSSRFRKSKAEEDKFELSVSQSKGFRTKTNTVVKSIKLAEELSYQNQKRISADRIQEKINKGDKLAEEIIKEKAHFEKLQSQVSAILEPKSDSNRMKNPNKNLDLYYRFKIQVNRLIASETFASKLRKLTSFMKTNDTKSASATANANVNELEDKLLKDVMERITSMRLGEVSQTDICSMKKQYDEKLERMLKDQQMTLRVEMEKKLHEKDVEVKQMIAELEQRFQNRAFVGSEGGYRGEDEKMKRNYGESVEVDSDFSIDSDEVSWKMDLWEVLPDYEKKKLYEKQGAEIANMLTEVLMKQVKQESLDRSADLSFEFPEEFNVSSSFESSFPDFKKSKRSSEKTNEDYSFKPAFNRSELQKDINVSQQKKKSEFPPLPGQNRKPPQDIVIESTFSKIEKVQNDIRDTVGVSQVVKILSKYKNSYLKKKNDTVRKILKTIQSKIKDKKDPLISHLAQLTILPSKQITNNDMPFIKAYEEDLIMELVAIYNKNQNRRPAYIEEEMKKMYDRLVITSQVKAAEASVRSANEIVPVETYIDLKLGHEEKNLKNEVVCQIVELLAAQFAKQMPKGRK